MRKFIPNLFGGVEPRKISRGNLENAFGFLLHLLSAANQDYSSQLTSIAGIIFNRLMIQFNTDPKALIAEIKWARSWYTNVIRDVTNGEPPAEFSSRWDYLESCPMLLSGLLPLLAKVSAKRPFVEMVFFHRIIYSILTMDRIIAIPVTPNYKSITNPYSGSAPRGQLDESKMILALEALGVTPAEFREVYNLQVKNFRYEIITSSGPNGQATWTAHTDARAWFSNLPLFGKLRVLLEESRLVSLLGDLMGTIFLERSDPGTQHKPILGRLHNIEEWGGKCRTVAILDYWTQMALTPLHNTVNHFLRNLPSDGTFNQEAVAERVRAWTSDGRTEVNSYDLTTATDRLPIELQKQIISYLMGSASFGEAWAAILQGRDFSTPEGETIRYAVGQPMGVRSSFPMLALSHHVIVQIAAQGNVENYTEYGIIGDDVVITNAKVGNDYLQIVTELGLEVNLSKSILHVDGARSGGELCKRLFVLGIEISSIPLKLVAATKLDGRLAPELQAEFARRTLDFTVNGFYTAMATLLDTESLGFLYKLNLLPRALTGLASRVTPSGTGLTDYKEWFKGIALTAADITNVFTYVACTEQLKRLDAILTNALLVFDTLSMKSEQVTGAAGLSPEEGVKLYLGLKSPLSPEEIAEHLSSVSKVHAFHPIIRAAEQEVLRLSNLLYQLLSLDETLVKQARAGLLDSFRNSLSDIWSDSQTARASQGRALLVKSLNLLGSLCLMDEKTLKLRGSRSADYTVVLSLVQRMWSARVTIGGAFTLNAISSKVNPSVTVASTKATKVLKVLSFDPKATISQSYKNASPGPS